MINNKLKLIKSSFSLCIFMSLSSHAISNNIDCSSLEYQPRKALVLKVLDGDTAIVRLQDGKQVSVRFYGVDTPESQWKGKWPAQPFSQEAKAFTSKLISNKNVVVDFNGQGTYGRCVGEIFIYNESVSYSLVENGLAWWYKRFSPRRADFKNAEINAKKHRVNIWSSSNPQAPWTYRARFQ